MSEDNGSNAFRASGYRGPWFQRNANAPVVGGNRFGYEPGMPNGPYAPYSAPKDVPTPKPADASTFPIKVTAPKIEIRGGGGTNAAPQIHVPGLPRMMQMPDLKVGDYMKPAPEASSSVINSGGNSTKNISQTFNQTTTVNGAENPRQAARIMESAFGNMHNLALRNAQSATV